MKPRFIILVRHGESEANRNWSVNCEVPNHLVKLTPKGYEQAIECGHKISRLLQKGDRILFYQSPYTRTRETADAIMASIGQYPHREFIDIQDRIEDPQMREQDFGNFQDTDQMKDILMERNSYGRFFYRIPNGESPADVYNRCSIFCESLFRKFDHCSPDVCILVSHGIWCRVFLMRYFHWPYEKFENLVNLPNAEPVILELQPDGKYKTTTELPMYDASTSRF